MYLENTSYSEAVMRSGSFPGVCPSAQNVSTAAIAKHKICKIGIGDRATAEGYPDSVHSLGVFRRVQSASLYPKGKGESQTPIGRKDCFAASKKHFLRALRSAARRSCGRQGRA